MKKKKKKKIFIYDGDIEFFTNYEFRDIILKSVKRLEHPGEKIVIEFLGADEYNMTFHLRD